jgi:hypothetical protein
MEMRTFLLIPKTSRMGKWSYSSTILDLGIRWRWVASFMLYLQEREPLNRRLGGPQRRCGPCGKRKISSPCRESNLGRPARMAWCLINCVQGQRYLYRLPKASQVRKCQEWLFSTLMLNIASRSTDFYIGNIISYNEMRSKVLAWWLCVRIRRLTPQHRHSSTATLIARNTK